MGTASKKSISLTTIAVSLAGLGVLVCLGIPLFFARPQVTLHNASELVESEIRAAQNRAAWLRRPLTLVFTADGYRALDPEGQPIRRMPNGRFLERSFRQDGVFEGVFFREIDLGGDTELVFSERGEADSAGRLVLAFENAECEMTIEQGTGQIHMTWTHDER